jgi:hypothetical protein
MRFGVSRLDGLLKVWLRAVRARSTFLGAIAEECPSRECLVYSPFHVCESETNMHIVIGGGLREGCKRAFLSFGIQIRSALGERTQVEPLGRRSRGMAQEMSNRGGQLTPEQAREGHRWIRLTVLAAVLQMWMMATVVALLVPHLLALFLVLGAAYSLAAPLLFRYLNRDVERRVITGGPADGLVQFARTPGLRSSSVLGMPNR